MFSATGKTVVEERTPPMNPKREDTSNQKRWKNLTAQIMWSLADPADLKLAIAAVTNNGGAIQFSHSRDGGTLILKAWIGLEEVKEYCTNPSDIKSLLQWLAATYS